MRAACRPLNYHTGMTIPLSLYVHIPWCISKCPYCDFNSHPLPADKGRGELPEADYQQALITDLEQDAMLAGGRKIESVFFGGGTPSLFTAESLHAVLTAADELVGLSDSVEVTMEANPGAIEYHALTDYREAGINRLSLGAQSFNDEHLRRLGRVHNSAGIGTAYAEARSAGFDNINLDLMYGLPGQTVIQALEDLNSALELGPEHLSHYHLTMEPGTLFGRKPPSDLPDDDVSWEMLAAGQRLLADAGFARYEVSAYGRPGFNCRHNLNYWQFGDYLGIGAGAHGKLTAADGTITRTMKPLKPAKYQRLALQQPPDLRGSAVVSAADARFEFMLNGMRLTGGVTPADFTVRTGQSPAALSPGLAAARERGLLEPEASNSPVWRPTALGHRFLDDLQGLFLPAPDENNQA